MSLMRICVIDSFYWYIGRQRIDDMQTFDRKSFFCQENSSFIIYYHNAKKNINIKGLQKNIYKIAIQYRDIYYNLLF